MPFIFVSKKNYESQIAKRALESSEAIIAEMGAEIHDDLIQRLTILRLSIDQLAKSPIDNNNTELLVIKLKTEFQQIIQSVRKISRKLMPAEIDGNSFTQSLVLLCQNLERPDMGKINFEFSGIERKLHPFTETYAYRIVQELIHNAFKHSTAWNVWVRVQWTNSHCLIEVEDDGTSFHKIPQVINVLRRKNNTLKMRSQVIGANITYTQGKKGLIALVAIQSFL